MKTTEVNLLKQEDRYSYLIEVKKLVGNIEDNKFVIPVIDVRDGLEARKKNQRND